MSNSKALLIGIDYFESPDNSLPGCINDIEAVQNMLITNYKYLPENIVMLSDLAGQDPTLQPTHSNIMTQLSSIIQSSSKCDEIWIHYSGHGSRIMDLPSKTYKEDFIVPCDYKIAGIITSHDIFDILKNSECKTIAVFDCCNSASMCGLPWSFTFDISLNTYITTQTNSSIIKNPNIFELAGSQDNQTSSDVYNILLGKYYGLLTRTLITCLARHNYQCPIMELYVDICKTILEAGYMQRPVLSSSSKNLNYMFTRPSSSLVKTVLSNNRNLIMNMMVKPRTSSIMMKIQ